MQAPSATSDSDLVESKLPRLRAKSELAEYVGRRVYLKDAITVGLSERVCHVTVLYFVKLIVLPSELREPSSL